MSTSAQNGGSIESWLLQEMALWHVIPIFIGLAVVGMALAHGAGLFLGVDATTVTQLSTRMIGGAALFSGILMGWTARRYKEEGKLE